MKTILVPVDLSAATTRVCDAACALAKLIRARVELLHVVEPPALLLYDAYAFDAGQTVGLMSAAEKCATRRLRALGRRCTARGVPTRTVQRTGLPVPTILTKAASAKAVYIVLGSHGHGAVYDLFAGSTAQGVLRKARGPVLVIPMGRR